MCNNEVKLVQMGFNAKLEKMRSVRPSVGPSVGLINTDNLIKENVPQRSTQSKNNFIYRYSTLRQTTFGDFFMGHWNAFLDTR